MEKRSQSNVIQFLHVEHNAASSSVPGKPEFLSTSPCRLSSELNRSRTYLNEMHMGRGGAFPFSWTYNIGELGRTQGKICGLGWTGGKFINGLLHGLYLAVAAGKGHVHVSSFVHSADPHVAISYHNRHRGGGIYCIRHKSSIHWIWYGCVLPVLHIAWSTGLARTSTAPDGGEKYKKSQLIGHFESAPHTHTHTQNVHQMHSYGLPCHAMPCCLGLTTSLWPLHLPVLLRQTRMRV